MAIRSIVKSTIVCDDCGKELAIIRTSAECLAVFEKEAKYTEVRCVSHSDMTHPTLLEERIVMGEK